MKRFLSMLLAALMLFPILTLSACKKDEENHERILNEIAESNRVKNEKRQAFLSSEPCTLAYAYVADALSQLLPECEPTISLEPGALFGADLSVFSDFSENAETRLSFFSQAQLYIAVNFWDFDIDPLQLCDRLMARQISGELAADAYGEDTYRMDAVSGEAVYYRKPEV